MISRVNRCAGVIGVIGDADWTSVSQVLSSGQHSRCTYSHPGPCPSYNKINTDGAGTPELPDAGAGIHADTREGQAASMGRQKALQVKSMYR